jgi:hypothetical protein
MGSFVWIPCWSNPSTLGACIRVWLDLVLQSEYNFCLSLSRPLLLQSEYNFCLSLSRILLPQSECTFCWNLSRPYILPRERVCGQLLIRSILVLLFSFEVPLTKKIIKKSCNKKSKKKRKKQQQRRGFVCVFFSIVRWCFVITFVPRLVSLAQSSLGPAYYHRWIISQLAFFANVVPVLPCLLLLATHSSTDIPTVASQGFPCQHWYTLFQVADLFVAFPILWGKVRTDKSSCEQVECECLAAATP